MLRRVSLRYGGAKASDSVVAGMGTLPLSFETGEDAVTLGLGHETDSAGDRRRSSTR